MLSHFSALFGSLNDMYVSYLRSPNLQVKTPSEKFEELSNKQCETVEDLKEYNQARIALLSYAAQSKESDFSGDEMYLYEACQNLAYGVCALGSEALALDQDFDGVHEELCLIALINFLKSKVKEGGATANKYNQLVEAFNSCLYMTSMLRSCDLREVSIDLRQDITLELKKEFQTTQSQLNKDRWTILPFGWRDKEEVGHFCFLSMMKCYRRSVCKFYLFDSRPNMCNHVTQLSSRSWKLHPVLKTQIDESEALEFMTSVLRQYSGSNECPATTENSENSEDTYDRYIQQISWSIVSKVDTICVLEGNGCVAESLKTFLGYWEKKERKLITNEQPSIFQEFQQYLQLSFGSQLNYSANEI